jgi:hypothetical protein
MSTIPGASYLMMARSFHGRLIARILGISNVYASRAI